MGTRADFYVGIGADAEWLGSIAMDGYTDGHPLVLADIGNEGEYRQAVEQILSSFDHATHPEQGWPWPWENSHTTDYAYAFQGGSVMVSCFGSAWASWAEYLADPEKPACKAAEVPDMSGRKNVTVGPRSGLIVLSG
jgi:hypothetical protein